jgi:murein endopeptidase
MGGRGAKIMLAGAALAAVAMLSGRPARAQALLSLEPAFPHIELDLTPPASEAPTTRYFPFLDGESTDRSISVGDTSNGFLVGGKAVRESDALGILPIQRKRGLRYGSEELVGMLEHAAASLYAATSTRMWIGNVGREDGGDIPWSVSHNSGRDADIAFAYRDMKRQPVDPPDLVPLTSKGVGTKRGLLFDPERSWLIIKALLTYPAAQVQYLFIEAGLRDLVLIHAQKTGEPVWLIQRAAAAMRQPVGSSPHHDHLHLRIYCSRRDVVGGCQNQGAVQPWATLHEDAKHAAIAKVAAVLEPAVGEQADQRKRAIERLTLLDARSASDAIRDRLADDAGLVRQAAARALGVLGSRDDLPTLVEGFDGERDLPTRIAMVQAVARLGGREAGRFLTTQVGVPRRGAGDVLPALDVAAQLHSPALLSLLPEAAALSREAIVGADLTSRMGRWFLGASDDDAARAVQLTAVAASAHAQRLEPIGALIGLLEDRDAGVRMTAAHALRMITNVTYRTDWAGGTHEAHAKGLMRWRAAYNRSRKASRAAWLVMGFRAEGYKVPTLQQKHLWELVRATTGGDHLSYNAQRLLVRLTDHAPESLNWSKNDACQHWLRWLKKRRKAYKLKKPPRKLVGACYSPAN